MTTANEVVQRMLTSVDVPIPDRERGGFQTIKASEQSQLRFHCYNDGSVLVEKRSENQTLDFKTYETWDKLLGAVLGRA
jgi:hypothetical protein